MAETVCRCGTKMEPIYDAASHWGICILRWCPECGMLAEERDNGKRWREPAKNVRDRLERELQVPPDPEPAELLKEKGVR